jgi:hypothetical protein
MKRNLIMQAFKISQMANCKSPFVHCGVLQFAIFASVAFAQRSVAEEAVSPTDEVIRLFDGQSLGDCYTWLKDTRHEDPRQVFRVTDRLLHVTGDGWGGILTNKRYRDYHLVLEYKWGERTWDTRKNAARDSGLLVHSNGRDGGYNGTWMPAIEVQIIEGGVGDIIPVPGPGEDGTPLPIAYTCRVRHDGDQVIWHPQGTAERFQRGNFRRVNWFGRDPGWKDVKDFRGLQDVESPFGEWTRLDVFCDGGNLEVYVNGSKVNEAFDLAPQAGRLQLQAELAEIFFRRWELWPLGTGPKPAPAEQE